jgi:hypothetical protein
MATKDWKKVKLNLWYNKKHKYYLEIKKYTSQYSVFAWGESHKNYDATVQTFKTKTQALRYAKSYMRKH